MFKRLSEPAAFDFATILMSLIFVGMGLLFTYIVGRQTTLACSRVDAAQNCQMKTTWMNLVQLNVRPIEDVKSATVEESCDDDGCTYRVRISTDQGPLPLGEVYSSGESDKQATADQVNAFARGQSDSLKVSNGGGLWVLFPLIFVAIGVGMVLRPLVSRLLQILAPR